MFPLTATVADPLADAASALLAVRESGLIVVPARTCEYQREQIERELRVSAQILQGVAAEDRATIALGIVGNIRHGLATGALIVARDDVAAHVEATIRGVQSELNASADFVPSVWFDAPQEVGSIIS